MQHNIVIGRGLTVNCAPQASRPSRRAAHVTAVARPHIAQPVVAPGSAQPVLQRLAFQASAAAVLLQVGPAHADAEVDGAVDNVIGAVKVTGELVKTGIVALQSGVSVLQQGYAAAEPALKQAYEQAAPIVSEVASQVSKVAAPAFKSAAPVITDTVRSSIQSAGVDLTSLSTTGGAVAKSANDAAAAAAPAVLSFVEFLTTSDPLTLGEYTLAFLGVYYLSPPLLRAVFNAGSDSTLSATAAIDVIVKESNLVFIDVRSNNEKQSAGVPDVPSSVSGKVIEVEFALVEDRKLRGALRDPSYIEAQTTALQIASLKKVNKGTKIILMDRNGGNAKAVAKELSKRGYKSVCSVEGGFDGRNGWIQSKLQIKPFSSGISFAPLLGKMGTQKTRSTRQLSA